MLRRIISSDLAVSYAHKINAVSLRSFRASSALEKEGYVNRQEKLGRPCSPDLQIYKLPIGAWSSIIVGRVTGVTMWAGLSAISLAHLGGVDIGTMVDAIAVSSIAPVAKFAIALPLTYHYLGACRHIYWDYTTNHMDNEWVDKSSKWILNGGLGLALFISLVTIEDKE